MEELLQVIRSDLGIKDRWRLLLGGSDPLLRRGVAAFDPAVQADGAEWLWGWMGDAARASEVERLTTLNEFATADAGRLLRNARLAVATGVAAGWLDQVSGHESNPGRLLLWLGRASGLEAGRPLVPVADLSRIAWSAETPERLEQLVRSLPASVSGLASGDYSRSRLRIWLEYWLNGRGHAPASDGLVRMVRFATVDSHELRAGTLHELRFLPLPPGAAELIEDPRIAFRPMAEDFHSAIAEQFRAVAPGRPLAWSVSTPVVPGRPGSDSRATFRGRSHSLAARVGLVAARDGLDLDPSCLLAAELDGEELKDVELEGKLNAAHASGKIRRVVIAGKSKFNPQDHPYGGMVIEGRQSIAEAVEDATGLAAGLRQYLDWVGGLADRVRPPYLAGRRLSDVYVEPDVFIERRRVDEMSKPEVGSPHVAITNDDDEVRFRYDHEDDRGRHRVPWAKELTSIRRAVLIGYPGEGKTALAIMTIRALAAQARLDLDNQAVGLADVTLPVLLRLEDVAKLGLGGAVVAALPDRSLLPLPGQFEKHLIASLARANAWLLLDGLDEVPEARHHYLRKALEPLTNAECRVIVTSRPVGYRPGALPFEGWAEYQLAPITPRQRNKFIQRWFADDSSRLSSKEVKSFIQSSTGIRSLSGNALLVSLVCFISTSRRLTRDLRRSDLYEAIIEEMFRRNIKASSLYSSNHISSKIRVLQRVAWTLFEKDSARWAFRENREWNPAIEKALGQHPPLLPATVSVAEFLEELEGVGLIVKAGNGHLAFLHRSFHEYLSAAHVATLENPLAEVSRFLWQADGKGGWEWKPAAIEFIPFVAGCMENPKQLVEMLLQKNDANPDAFKTMIRIAGSCLGEMAQGSIDVDMANRITNEICNLWKTLSGARELVRHIPVPWGIDKLIKLIYSDQDGMIRWAAAESIGIIGDRRAYKLISKIVQDSEIDVMDRKAAVETLGKLGESQALDLLISVLNKPKNLNRLQIEDLPVRRAAAKALGDLDDERAVDHLIRIMRDHPDFGVREAAIQALGDSDHASYFEALVHALGDSDRLVRCAAAKALGSMREPRASTPLVQSLRSEENEWTVQAICEALIELGARNIADSIVVIREHHKNCVFPNGRKLRAWNELLSHLEDPRAEKGLTNRQFDKIMGTNSKEWARVALEEEKISELHIQSIIIKFTDKKISIGNRIHYAYVLGLLRSPDAISPLVSVLLGDEPSPIREAAAEGLALLSSSRAASALRGALMSANNIVIRRKIATCLIYYMNYPTWLPPLL